MKHQLNVFFVRKKVKHLCLMIALVTEISRVGFLVIGEAAIEANIAQATLVAIDHFSAAFRRCTHDTGWVGDRLRDRGIIDRIRHTGRMRKVGKNRTKPTGIWRTGIGMSVSVTIFWPFSTKNDFNLSIFLGFCYLNSFAPQTVC